MKAASKDPLVSVLVPAYNAEKYIEACLNSILRQTYQNIEVIIINDGSRDRTKNILQKMAANDNRVHYFTRRNRGLSASRNFAVAKASGEYIAFVDADDIVEKNYIELLYRAIERDGSDAAISAHTVVFSSNRIIEATGEHSLLTPLQVHERILYNDGINISSWGKLYKKSLFDGIKYPEGKIFEDTAKTNEILDRAKTISIVSEPTYNYIIHNSSITREPFNHMKLDMIDAVNSMTNYLGTKYPNLKKACAYKKMNGYLSALSAMALSEARRQDAAPIMSYIKTHRREILRDRRIPKRDRVALHITRLGYPAFRFSFRAYKILGRRIENV